ncbi:hypothetical protein QUA70_19785 [Microcoleus sp. LAD1_D5]|uniref:hypothetical protein n=1 Tax=Microcoleus sp. LAD1_D5 TaxID=2818813 RepID=UPI002FCEA18E
MGTKASGRPGGNPGLKKHAFKPKTEKTFEKIIAVRMSLELFEAIKSVGGKNYQDQLRSHLEEIYLGKKINVEPPKTE